MKPEYWLGRWQRGETGWQQTEVEPNLINHFANLSATRVFVPLCGKSLDLIWLAQHGHEVIGVELSEIAVREFFTENKINFTVATDGDFKHFQSERISILQGDFFKLKPSHLGSVGAVYDRAALIALPPQMRSPYTQHMIELLKSSAQAAAFRFIQIVLERIPHDLDGPPHSIQAEEILRHYQEAFEIQLLTRELIETLPSGTQVNECVYSLKAK